MSPSRNCPVCAREHLARLFFVSVRGTQHSIMECAFCGAAFLEPSLSREEQCALYDSVYFDEFYNAGNRSFLEAAGLGLLGKLRPFLPGSGRVLDIGAAWGCYLEAFRSSGWTAEGVEASKHARDTAYKVYQLRLHEDLFSAPLAENTFNLVLMSQFLEHVADPRAYLDRAYRLLKPGGILYVSVPNFGSARAQRLKDAWPELRPGEHLLFFTRRSLRFVVEQAYFRVLELETPQDIISRKGCEAVIGGKSADALSAFLNRYAPGLKRLVRGLASRCYQGEGLELVARKEKGT